MSRKIYLFRHGETEWNVAGKMQGRLDSPLTERGRQQALAHGRLLAKLPPPDCYWVSPAGRTRATAHLIFIPWCKPPSISAMHFWSETAVLGQEKPRRRCANNTLMNGI